MSAPWAAVEPQVGLGAQEAAKELLARRAARASFLGFARYMQPEDQQPQAHHILLCDALDKVERGEIDRLMVFMPPGSAKSTYGSVLYEEYFLGRNPQLTVIGASHTADLANRFSRRVRNGINSQEFGDVFPHVKIAGDSSSVVSWETNQGGEYKPVGVDGTITGRRADLMVIDDPVKNREAADSPTQREKAWQWWLSDARTRLKPGGRVVVICTRWHEDDLAGRMLAEEPERWTVIKIPMEAGENDPLGRQPGERLWPEWFTDQMVIDAKRDTRSWISLYQQEPRPVEGAEFKRVWINRYDHWPKDSNRVILVDPSGGKKKGGKPLGDYTSMWVVALGKDHNAYVVDGQRARLNLTERTELLFELHKKWKPMQTRYEEYGMQADIEHIRTQMESRDYRFKIYEMGGNVAKEARIRRLIPWFEGGRIWFPKNMYREIATGDVQDIVHQFIEEEFAAFPVGKFDDAFDCLARLAEPKPALPWPKEHDMTADTNSAWAVLDELTGY